MFSFNFLFSWKSIWYSCLVNFKSLTYSCIVLSFFRMFTWKFSKSFSSSMRTTSMCRSLVLFFVKSIHAKNPIIDSIIGNFFSPVSNSISLYLSCISFTEKFNTSPAFFITKLYAECFLLATEIQHLPIERTFLFGPNFLFCLDLSPLLFDKF